VNFELAGSTFIGANTSRGFERFNDTNFRNGGQSFYAHSEHFKKVTLDAGLDKNIRINYDPAGTLRAFRGDSIAFHGTFTLRPTTRLKLDEIYFYNRLKSRDDSFDGIPAPVSAPTTVFVNHEMRSKLNYQFNREFSLRLILDYNATLPNATLSSLDKSKAVAADVLLTWLLHPGTAFYLGYTDRLENLGILAGPPPTLVRLNFPSTTTDRAVFVKLSYLFRF
jgi:hypothetical protein